MASGLIPRSRDLVARVGPGAVVGVEVGVWRGQFAEALLRLHPRLTLYMVDRWNSREQQPRSARSQASIIAEAMRRTDFAGHRRVVVVADSVEAARKLPDASMDFVFIDADHTYEGCRRDIEAWLPKVRPGGLLGGHDYHPPYTESRGYGVCQAVDEAFGDLVEFGPETTWYLRL